VSNAHEAICRMWSSGKSQTRQALRTTLSEQWWGFDDGRAIDGSLLSLPSI